MTATVSWTNGGTHQVVQRALLNNTSSGAGIVSVTTNPPSTPPDQPVITSQATRNQARNLEDARARVADLIRAALVTPRRRVHTAPPAGARRRRLAGKKRRADVKRWRARPGEAD